MQLLSIRYSKLSCLQLCVVAELSVAPTDRSPVIPSVVINPPYRARHVHSPEYHVLSYSE